MKRLLLELGGKGAALVFDDADVDRRGHRDRQRVGASTAVRSAPRRRARSCTAAATTSWSTRLAAMRRHAEGRRPARRRHDRRTGHLGRAARPHRGVRRRRRRRGRRHRRRRSPAGAHRPRLLRRARRCSPACKPRHDAGAGGDLRPGGRGACRSTTTTRRSPSPTAPTSASTTTCSPATPSAASALAGRLRSGNVGINTAQRNMETPFGGFKMSGIGRDGGDFGLHAYTEMQSVVWPGMSRTSDRHGTGRCSRACA